MALAATLLVSGLVEAGWAIGAERQFALALLLPLTIPIAWRRLHPSAVTLVVTAALVAQLPWASLRFFDQTFTGFVCVLLASYALGRYGRAPCAVVVLAACTLALALALGWYDHSVGSFVLGVVFVAAPAATGQVVAARSELRDVLDRQAEMLRENAEVAARIRVAEVRGHIAGEAQDLVSHRVHEMVDRSEAASLLAQTDSHGAAALVATVEVDGRAALDAMRSMLSVLRAPDLVATSLDRGAATGEASPARHLPLRRVELLLAAGFVVLIIGETLASPDAPPLVSLALLGPLLTFVIGARTRGRTAWVALGLVLAAVAVVSLLVGEGGWGDYVFPSVLVALAWLAGQLVREQNDLVEQARVRAASLERGAPLRAAAAATDERLRLARELHDVLAHTLMVMVVQAGAARRSLESGRVSAAAEALRVIEETGRDAANELRRLLTLVNLDVGDPLTSESDGTPALSDLPSLVDKARAAGLAAELVVEGKPVPVPGGVALAVYRVAQEAVTNVIRHADAQHVHLRLRYEPGLIQLVVHDDGPWVPVPHGGASGNGITGMRERTGIYGGELLAGPSPGNGFMVSATIPFAEMLQEQPA